MWNAGHKLAGTKCLLRRPHVTAGSNIQIACGSGAIDADYILLTAHAQHPLTRREPGVYMEGRRVVGGAQTGTLIPNRSPLLRSLSSWQRNPDRLLRPSACAPSQRHGRLLSVQAQQVMPSVRRQSSAQAEPASRRTLARQPVPALAPPRPAQSTAAARPVFLPRNLIMNKQACSHLHHCAAVSHARLHHLVLRLQSPCFPPSNTCLVLAGDCKNIREAAGIRRAAVR